jgi:soluble lytic murein transglycosylase-like protein
MLEGMTSALSRIEEIRARFKNQQPNGIVNVAPHYNAETPSNYSNKVSFKQAMSNTQIKTKIAGKVEAASAYDAIIEEKCSQYGVNPALVKSVIQAESGFRANAVSQAGAMGLMQLMPRTARGYGLSDPFDPEQNIDAGVRYLKGQLDRFDGSKELALAAYNAGPGNVIKYGRKVPPFRETQNYVNKVLSNMEAYE